MYERYRRFFGPPNIVILGVSRPDPRRARVIPTDTPSAEAAPKLEITTSPHFAEWLAEAQTSLAFTTYQAGKLFLVGLHDDGRLSIFERTFERCMGLCAAGATLYMSARYQLWRFEDALGPDEAHEGYDRVYVPQVAYTTGDLDIHDIAMDGAGEAVFVATLFGCLARPSATHSLAPLWKPPFLSRLAAEDRCHLNGLAMVDGRPRYVTALSTSDVAEGWREHRRDGGCVIDLHSDAVVISGLSMPHSPRWYRGRLWLHDSGSGRFGAVDLEAGRFEPVAFCPGYLRGLDFAGDFAVVGLSLPRRSKALSGLALDEELARKDLEPRCAVCVIDLRTGETAHWLRLEGIVEELYDVVALQGVRRPMAIGLKTDEISRVITVAESGTPAAAAAPADAAPAPPHPILAE